MRKFEFAKAYEEVEIAGKVYRVDFSDEKLEQYQRKFKQFYEEAQQFTEKEIEKLSIDEQSELLKKQRQNMKEVTEMMLGEGTFEELFELAGRSTVNYMDLLEFLSEILAEKTEKMKEDKRKKYVKKAR
jgi:hypothetical protein